MRSSVSTRPRSKADVLSARALGRATLARQLLLERAAIPPLAAIERLAGMQAQVPRPPFIGLWSRVVGFERADLHRLVHDRSAVRATMMRGTIHLVSAADFVAMRPALEPLLGRILRRLEGLDRAAVLKHAKMLLPGPFDIVRAELAARFPQHDPRTLGYGVQMHLPLVRIPSDTRWSYSNNADFHVAEHWLGTKLAKGRAEELVRRYLAAFGPASVKDATTWSGVPGLARTFEAMRGSLRVFASEDGRELFDLPDAPRPPEDAPAPVRFLPEYDNLMLAFAHPGRVIEPARRPALCTKNGIIAATFLVDGRVAGTWALSRDRDAASIQLHPFGKLPKPALAVARAEAEALLRWHEPDAKRFTIR